MGKLTFLEYGEVQSAPKVPGIELGTIAEGGIVKLNENGSPVEFYVACHNYESALNGTGRTLLVRKDCYDARAWHTSNVNAYASCTLDSWFNGDYKALHDAAVQSAMGTTKFYYTPGNGNKTVTTLDRSVFALSVTELGQTATYANTEGSALPIASTLQVAYRNGSLVAQLTRSCYIAGTSSVYYLGVTGKASLGNCTSTYGSRPCFTLPSTALFDQTTLEFKGA